jgi:hypothetical protein
MARPKMTDEQKAAAAAGRLAERGEQTEHAQPQEALQPIPEPVSEPTPDIDSHLRANDVAKAEQGVFLVLLRHPDASPTQTHIRDRHDIGVVLERGPLMVRWSDGSEA